MSIGNCGAQPAIKIGSTSGAQEFDVEMPFLLSSSLFSTHHTTLDSYTIHVGALQHSVAVGQTLSYLQLFSSWRQPPESLPPAGFGTRQSALLVLVPSSPCPLRDSQGMDSGGSSTCGESQVTAALESSDSQVRALQCGAPGTRAAPLPPHDHGILHTCSIANSGPRESYGEWLHGP